MARKKRGFSVNDKSPTNGRFWEEYGREDAMKMRKPRGVGKMRMVRPKSYKPRRKSYRRRGRR